MFSKEIWNTWTQIKSIDQPTTAFWECPEWSDEHDQWFPINILNRELDQEPFARNFK